MMKRFSDDLLIEEECFNKLRNEKTDVADVISKS